MANPPDYNPVTPKIVDELKQICGEDNVVFDNEKTLQTGAPMTYDEYINSIAAELPPSGLSETLTSLWWDKKGDWDRAHSIAQDIPTVQGSAVHAYLHREEGVLWNADYWYTRAGRKRPDIPLDTEWQQLVEEMLS
jgi:hypothetical protein